MAKMSIIKTFVCPGLKYDCIVNRTDWWRSLICGSQIGPLYSMLVSNFRKQHGAAFLSVNLSFSL